MRIPRHRSSSASGGLMAVTLVMTMLAGLFLAGWVTVANARAMQARFTELAAKRRIMLENSRGLIKQTAYQTAFSGYSNLTGGSDMAVAVDAGGINTGTGWSALQLYGNAPTYSSYPETGYYSKLFPYNPLGQRPGATFISTQKFSRASVYAGSPTDPYLPTLDPFDGYIFMRGIFPALTGDVFVVYQKPDGFPSEIQLSAFQVGVGGATPVPARFVVRDPASFQKSSELGLGVIKRLPIRATRWHLQKVDDDNPVTVQNLNGTEFAPLNLPAAPSTFGIYATSTGGTSSTKQMFAGNLDVVSNTKVPTGMPVGTTYHPNCLVAMQDRDATSSPVVAPVQTISVGTTTGVSSDPWYIADEYGTGPTYRPPAYPAGYGTRFQVLYINLDHANLPNMRIYPVVEQVVLVGQKNNGKYNAASSLAPRSIVFLPLPGGQSFKDVRLVGENNRRLVLGMKAHHTGEPIEFWWEPPAASVTTPLTLDWRLIVINEGRTLNCFRPTGAGGTPDSVQITGGIFSNWTVLRSQPGTVPGGDTGSISKFVLVPEWNGGHALARILPRESWLETYFDTTPQ